MKDAQKLLVSGIFIVLLVWLMWSAYWSLKLYVSLPDIFAVPDPFAPLYFSSTLSVAFLFVGLTVRTVGVAVAIFAAYSYFRKGWTSTVRIMVVAAIILEAVYLISIIPTAWVGPDVNDFVLIPEATIPSLFEAIFVPIPLIILAIKLRWQGKPGTATKWAAISGFHVHLGTVRQVHWAVDCDLYPDGEIHVFLWGFSLPRNRIRDGLPA